MIMSTQSKHASCVWDPFCTPLPDSPLTIYAHLYAALLAEWVTAEMLNWGHLPLLPTSAGVRFSQNMLPILEPMPYG